jgi:hypothetical protein
MDISAFLNLSIVFIQYATIVVILFILTAHLFITVIIIIYLAFIAFFKFSTAFTFVIRFITIIAIA